MQLDQKKQCSIKLLPEHLINQIKAGEVIERPASLLKELIENSIDADSSYIDIVIKDQGLGLISIEDDGKGISFDDLPMAFTKHATSKLNFFEELYSLRSYGFRGEALSSMASISRVECTSSPKDNSLLGGKYVIHGGKTLSHTPFKSDHSGTSIFIKDLFYNTPARLKFIKTKTTEQNAIERIINAFIISNPSISFSIKEDDHDKIIYKQKEQAEHPERIKQLFQGRKNIDGKLLHAHNSYQGIDIDGHFSYQSNKSNAFKHHFLFVNNRLFVDKKIHHLIIQGLSGFWPELHTGHYVLFITIPADQIDINVHPSKTHIKFFNENLIYSLIMETIKKAVMGLKLHQDIPSFPSSRHDLSDNASSSHTMVLDKSDHHQFEAISSSKNIYYLSNRFIIIRNNLNYLVNVGKLIRLFLKDNFNKLYPFPEEKIIPLLISEPFNFHHSGIKKFLSPLTKAGFHFDTLSEHMLVLRTIPDFCLDLPIDLICMDLLNNLKENEHTLNNTDFLNVLNQWMEYSRFDFAFNIDSNKMITIFNSFEITRLISSQIITQLTDHKLDFYFQG